MKFLRTLARPVMNLFKFGRRRRRLLVADEEFEDWLGI